MDVDIDRYTSEKQSDHSLLDFHIMRLPFCRPTAIQPKGQLGKGVNLYYCGLKEVKIKGNK